MSRKTGLLAIVAVTLTTTVSLPSCSLQAQAPPRTAVAIPENFPAIDASAVVVRERSKNVILLKESEVSPELLFAAVSALRRAWTERPAPETGEMIPILAYAVEDAVRPDDRRRLTGVLRRLDGVASTDLGSWGVGRLVQMPER